MLDLHNVKYDIDTLKKNIYAISLIDILKTQIITEDFAVNYLLNEKYQLTREEELITIDDIIKYQPHLSETELLEKYELNKKLLKLKIKRVDSWNEFELNSQK